MLAPMIPIVLIILIFALKVALKVKSGDCEREL